MTGVGGNDDFLWWVTFSSFGERLPFVFPLREGEGDWWWFDRLTFRDCLSS